MPSLVIDMHEWETRSPENDDALVGVSLSDDPTVLATARELTRSGKVEIVELRAGLHIQTSSFVGRLELGDLHLTIRPKIAFDPLVSLLRYAFNLRDLRLYSETMHSVLPDTFQDLLILQLAEEANELISRGLQRRYVQREQPLTTPRGRIDVQRIACQGGVMEATIPCVYYPRLDNNLVNQVLLVGLRLAAGLTLDLVLRARLRRLAALMEDGVTAITLTASVMRDLDRQLNRLTAAYEPALTLIALLLEATGSVLEDDEQRAKLPGFLFDMNRFFETLMSRFLRENLQGYEVQDQYRLRGLMAYAPEHNPKRRRAPTPRPDYIVMQHGQIVAMLDAKYRDIWEHGLPREMLYQLAIYALSHSDIACATILYPTTSTLAQPEVIEIRELAHGEHCAQVVMRPVNLARLEELVTTSDFQAQRARVAYAAGLIR